MFYVFSFPPGVYVWTLNLVASIPGPSILTSTRKINVKSPGFSSGAVDVVNFAFSKFFRRQYELISKSGVGLGAFLCGTLPQSEFHSDLMTNSEKFKNL